MSEPLRKIELPIPGMPWFDEEHDMADVARCRKDMTQAFYGELSLLRNWYHLSGGTEVDWRAWLLPKENDMNVAIQFIPPDGIPSPLRKQQPDALAVVSIINDLGKDTRRIFADALCVSTVQSIAEAQNLLREPFRNISGSMPDYHQPQLINVFGEALLHKDFQEMDDQIRKWEERMCQLHSMIANGTLEVDPA